MVACPTCGKELKTAQALRGHRALAHRSTSAPSPGAVGARALADLRSELLAAVDKRLEPVLEMVRALSAERSTVSTEPAQGEHPEPAPEPEPVAAERPPDGDPYLANIP